MNRQAGRDNSWLTDWALGLQGHPGPGLCMVPTPNISIWGTISTKGVVLTCRAQFLRIIIQCDLVDTASLMFQGQKGQSQIWM